MPVISHEPKTKHSSDRLQNPVQWLYSFNAFLDIFHQLALREVLFNKVEDLSNVAAISFGYIFKRIRRALDDFPYLAERILDLFLV
jgi:hypothetical protein